MGRILEAEPMTPSEHNVRRSILTRILCVPDTLQNATKPLIFHDMTHITTINRLEIRQRKRSGRDARTVPLYGVWSPDDVLLKNFRRLNHAVQWASATHDFLPRKLSR